MVFKIGVSVGSYGGGIAYPFGIKESLRALDYSNPDHVYVGVEAPKDSHEWEQDPDVLDTWASSYLWPMANPLALIERIAEKEMDFLVSDYDTCDGF